MISDQRSAISSQLRAESRLVTDKLSHLAAGLRPLGLPLGVIGVIMALYGQAQLHAGHDEARYGWLLVLGALYFGIGLADVALERPADEVGQTERPWLWALGLAGAAVGLLSYRYFGNNTFSAPGTVLWLGGLAAFLASFGAVESLWHWLKTRARALSEHKGIVIPWTGLALVAIVLVAIVLRFDRLDIIPGDMGEDLPHNFNNAKSILNGDFSIFFPSYPGREGMMFYLQALYGRIFGLSYYGLKATSALIGIATVATIYVVARDLYSAEVGLYAALFLAVSRWHVTISRMGLRLILMPLFVLIVIGLLARALRSRRRLDFALLGLALGLGMYTYNAWLVVPPAAIAIILVYQLVQPATEDGGWTPPGIRLPSFVLRAWHIRSVLPGILIALFTALLVFVPLGRYAHDYPEQYGQRIASRLTGVEAQLPTNIPLVFLENLKKSALMFNVRGDGVARYNIAFEPHLGPVSAALMLAGLAYALARWRRGHNLALILMLLATILPPALAIAFPNEVPNAGRGSGALAPAFLLVALPLPSLRRRLTAAMQARKSLRLTLRAEASPLDPGLVATGQAPPPVQAACQGWQLSLNPIALTGPLLALGYALLILTETQTTAYAYFVRYPDQMNLHNYDMSGAIARTIDELWPNGPVYTVITPYWYDGNAVRAQLQIAPSTWQNEIWPDDFGPDKPPLANLHGKAAFIVHPSDQRSIQILQQFFPKGVLVAHPDNSGGIAFYTFIGER